MIGQQIDLRRMDIMSFQKRYGLLHILFVPIHFLDHRDPDVDPRPVSCKTDQVLKDQLIVRSYVLPVKLRIHHLHIIEEGIHIRQDTLKLLIRDISAGINGKRYPLAPKLLRCRKDVIHIHCHGFSSGECHTAAGILIKDLILHKLLHKFLHRIFPADDLTDPRRTEVLTPAAQGTGFTVCHRLSVLKRDRLALTGAHTGAAAGAFIRIVLYLFPISLGLRIMAPFAA